MANPYPNFINDTACGHIRDEIQGPLIARIDNAFTMLKLNLFQDNLLIGDEDSMASHIVCPLMARVAELCGQVIPAHWKTYGDPPGSGVTRWVTGFRLPADPATLYSSPHFNDAIAEIMEDDTFCEYLRNLMRDGLVDPAARPAALAASIAEARRNEGNNEMAAALAESRAEARRRLVPLSKNTIVEMGYDPNKQNDKNALEEMGFRLEGGRRNTRKHRKNRKSRRSTKNRKASRKNRSRKH